MARFAAGQIGVFRRPQLCPAGPASACCHVVVVGVAAEVAGRALGGVSHPCDDETAASQSATRLRSVSLRSSASSASARLRAGPLRRSVSFRPSGVTGWYARVAGRGHMVAFYSQRRSCSELTSPVTPGTFLFLQKAHVGVACSLLRWSADQLTVNHVSLCPSLFHFTDSARIPITPLDCPSHRGFHRCCPRLF